MQERPTLSPASGDYDLRNKARLLRNVLRAMWVVVALGLAVSLLESKNDLRITAGFYGFAFSALAAFGVLLRRGRVVATGWAVAAFVWCMIAAVTLFFGGLQGENASVFGVSIMLIGSVQGGRAAVWLAVLSSVWCGALALLEVTGTMPPQLGAYSPINAWTAATVALVLMSVLLGASLNSLRELHVQALTSANERDAALRRSIQSQKMELVGNVASGIAHDFNNLLMVIGGATEQLGILLGKEHPETSAPLKDLAAATSRAALMTRHLLTFGGAKGTEPGATDLGALVRSFEPMLPRLLGPRIEVVVSATRGLFVRGSRVGLEQILLNLAVNARDAMPKGGTLTIRAFLAEGEGRGVLCVEDTGVGMDEETKSRLFEPFFTTKPTGTGLGLATSRDLVVHFDGTISVRSAPDEGTTFTIHLPQAQEPKDARVVESEPIATEATGGRVLVVDDDPMVRRATMRLLTPLFEVVAVADGAEAVALLGAASDFVCVVSDIAMPLFGGEALAAKLAHDRPALAVVLMSGNRVPAADPRTPHRAFVQKPATREHLLEAIAQARGA